MLFDTVLIYFYSSVYFYIDYKLSSHEESE